MARQGKFLLLGSIIGLSLALSCSSDDSGGTGSNDSGGTGGSGADGSGGGAQPEPCQDDDGDGVCDVCVDQDGDGICDLSGEVLGIAAMDVTEEQLVAQRDAHCTGWVAQPEPLGATLFMVVDASSSMNEPANGTGERTKWEVTRDALIEVVGEFSDDTAVGLLAYPNKVIDGTSGDPSMCVNVDALVPLGKLGNENHRQTVIDALNAVRTNTCTPTHDAYRLGLESFAAAPAPGQKYIMLMTDGQPTLFLNCEPGTCQDNPIGSESYVIDEIARAYNELKIKTFMLGCPGSEEHVFTGLDNRWWLSQAAELGGTSPGNCVHEPPGPFCHFDMTQAVDFGAALRAALMSIVGQVVACDYAIPAPPPNEVIDLTRIRVYLRPAGTNPIEILRDPTGECTNGGWYLDEESWLVTFCPQTCALAQSDPNAEVELMFGCTSPQVPE